MIESLCLTQTSSHSFTVRCRSAFSYYGKNCEIRGTNVTCVQNPCLNNGTCINNVGMGYNCSCLASFTGVQCETELDLPAPCPEFYYGENCTTHCEPANDCEHGHYVCDTATGDKVCIAGYKGTDCKLRDFPATLDPECPTFGSCKNDGQCFNKSCCCEPGYEGTYCQEEKIECSSNPCVNGGTCRDELDGYICHCIPGKLIVSLVAQRVLYVTRLKNGL